MLVATFGPTSVLVGKTLTYEGGQFILQDYGPLTLDQVISYDRQGHLTWTRDDLRAWAYSLAGASAGQQQPVLAPIAPVTVSQTAQAFPQQSPSKASWGGATSRSAGLSSAAKTLIGVGIGLVALVLIVAVVVAGGDSSSLSSAEQTQLAFFVDHAPQLRALIEDTQAVLDSGNTDAAYVAAAMEPICDSYGQLADEYNATNGGTLVGGRLADLEILWESCAADIQTADTAILECYTSPDTVDTEAGGVALVTATQSIDEIDIEIDRLSGQ